MKASQRRARAVQFSIRTPDQRDVLACTRKSKISTKQRAKESAARVSRESGHKISIYECPTCGHWHLTGSDQAVERERRRS